jgi:hypothetical protein
MAAVTGEVEVCAAGIKVVALKGLYEKKAKTYPDTASFRYVNLPKTK